MKLSIEMTFDDDALQRAPYAELSCILQAFMRTLDCGKRPWMRHRMGHLVPTPGNDSGKLRDGYGNTVGTWRVFEDE